MTMLAEKKLLSDCGERLVIDDNPTDLYVICIDKDDYLVIEVGAKMGTPASRFTHPNIVASRKHVFEFKHYRASGGKFWTACAGISHFFVVPRNKIFILPEKGHSWIPAEINGVKVHFNVSGGGGSGGWTDYLHSMTSISVGHNLRDIKKIAEVSVQDADMNRIVLERINLMDTNPNHDRANELERWQKMADAVSKEVKTNKEYLLELIEHKKLVTIVLKDG